MLTSAVLTDDEVDTLNILVPSYFKVSAEERRVLLTLYAPDSTPPEPLFAYEILPAGKPDFEGTLLSELIEELAKTVTTAYREMQRSDAGPSFNTILKLINGASVAAVNRCINTGEYQVLTADIYTLDEATWSTAVTHWE